MTFRKLYFAFWSTAWILINLGLGNIGLIPDKAIIWMVINSAVSCIIAWFLAGQKLLTAATIIVLLIKWHYTPGAIGIINFSMSMALLLGAWMLEPYSPKRRRIR